MKSLKIFLSIIIGSYFIAGCSNEIVETQPATFTDKSEVKITCNANQGNKGLLDFPGDVFVHVGLITDSSQHPTDWRYVKFNWGSTEPLAKASPAGDNKWSYKIPDIRDFFGVKEGEKIFKLAILFREGNCVDTFCKVLRNSDKSDIMLDLVQK